MLLSDVGVVLYQKNYRQGNPDFVQVIDLGSGAIVRFMHGQIADPGAGKGVYGGNNPSILGQSLMRFWVDFVAQHQLAFCITNGSFFYLPEHPTRLAFPLKVDGVVVSDGYGIREYPEQKLMLELWPGHADIRPLSQQALYGSDAPDILAGLSEEANKRAPHYVGRTFAGVDDRDGDGQFETLLIFNTKTARQVDAAKILRNFGADKVIMFDGGGSTQLTCRGKVLIESERLIPEAIAVAAASGPRLAARVIRQPGWVILLEGESARVEIEVTNDGYADWIPGEVQVVLDISGSQAYASLPLREEVKPGEGATFTWAGPEMWEWGVYPAEWYLAQGSQAFPGERRGFPLIVLPLELKPHQPELEDRLQEWNESGSGDLSALALSWIQTQLVARVPYPTPASNPSIDLEDIVWVPVLMSPVAVLLVYVVGRRRGRMLPKD